MDGEEGSLFALCDGKQALLFGGAQDHKRAFDGDLGPNTGGMGAYSPAPVFTPDLVRQADELIVQPTIRHMAEEGAPYRGVLYAGLMATDEGPKVVEFNARFGDPECQVLMMRFAGDIVPYLLGCARGGRVGSAGAGLQAADGDLRGHGGQGLSRQSAGRLDHSRRRSGLRPPTSRSSTRAPSAATTASCAPRAGGC